jgi:hypothetical protein
VSGATAPRLNLKPAPHRRAFLRLGSGCVVVPVLRRTFIAMKRDARFEMRLPAARRQELADLAAEVGISSSDLARLAISRLLARPGSLLGPATPNRSDDSERAAQA